jgi:hypothetical protein
MQKFPYWHDDALDSLAYQYDLFRDFRFGKFAAQEKEGEWDKAFREGSTSKKSNSWLYV